MHLAARTSRLTPARAVTLKKRFVTSLSESNGGGADGLETGIEGERRRSVN
jgi:hypothetical protein